jgi:hypothetical protein
MDFRGSNRGGVYFIEAGDERYEIVEAFVGCGPSLVEKGMA